MNASDYEKAMRHVQEAYDRARDDADGDREAYRHALAVATDELGRIEGYLAGGGRYVSQTTKARRKALADAIAALTELASELGAF